MTTETSTKKYRQVARTLRREIDSGKWRPGERLPGEQDLAGRFEVAHMTIRQAVTALVTDGLLLRVQGKGTFIVAQDRSQPQPRPRYLMTMLFPTNWQRMDPYYFPELLEGFQQAMEMHGQRPPLYETHLAESPGYLEPGTAVACVLLGESEIRLVERLRDNGYRVLAVNHYTGRRSIPCVRIDNASGVEQAVDHLVSLGHERIAFLLGPSTNVDAAERLRGFRSAVKQHGLQRTTEADADFTEASGYAAAQVLLASPHPPTAIACASDLSAIGAGKAARECGRSVPRDLSIVGFGDFPVAAYVEPSLTTIRQARKDLGRMTAESLLLLAEGEEASDTILKAKLVLRESTASPNR